MRVKATIAMFAVASALVVFFLVMAGPGITADLDPSSSPSPSPSPSASASPTPEPASAALVARSLKAQKAAKATRATLARVRRCFKSSPPVAVGRAPKRSASAEAWTRALRKWKHQRADWRGKIKAGRAKMLKPGGTSNGVRWMPLARWVGWPEHTLSHLSYIIMRESSGRVRALNSSSGCAGLLQLHPCHGVKNPFDPEVNLRAGLRLYRKCGWSPWAL